MAILDSIQLLLAVISGSHVAPTLTAILVHFTIPLTTIFTKVFYPSSPHQSLQNDESQHLQQGSTATNEYNPNESMTSQRLFGSTLILLSIILALSPAILTLVYPDFFLKKNAMASRTAWNTIIFVLSCVPGAASQVYKEHAMATLAQPVDATSLNFLLSAFSLLFSMIISPVFYSIQGLAGAPLMSDTLYPTKQISKNFSDGLKCFIGTLDNSIQVGGYPEEAHCDFAYGIVMVHVLSIIIVHYSLHKICLAGALKIMHRGFSAGIVLSVISMMYYEIFVDNIDYGFFPSSWHITCAAVLVMGNEVFQRVSMEEPSFETKYLEVGNAYSE